MIRDFPRALRMLDSVLGGATLRDTGAQFGVTGNRVSQLARWSASILRGRAVRRGETAPDDYDLSDLREHADFYREQIRRELNTVE